MTGQVSVSVHVLNAFLMPDGVCILNARDIMKCVEDCHVS